MTGAGMIDIKAALEAKGDMHKAVEVFLRKRRTQRPPKRRTRVTAAGLIDSYVHQGSGGDGEVNCETDFVARTDDFKNFVHEVAMQIAATSPALLSPRTFRLRKWRKKRNSTRPNSKARKASCRAREKSLMASCKNIMGKYVCLNQPAIRETERTVGDLLSELIAKLGENIVINRFSRMELGVNDA